MKSKLFLAILLLSGTGLLFSSTYKISQIGAQVSAAGKIRWFTAQDYRTPIHEASIYKSLTPSQMQWFKDQCKTSLHGSCLGSQYVKNISDALRNQAKQISGKNSLKSVINPRNALAGSVASIYKHAPHYLEMPLYKGHSVINGAYKLGNNNCVYVPLTLANKNTVTSVVKAASVPAASQAYKLYAKAGVGLFGPGMVVGAGVYALNKYLTPEVQPLTYTDRAKNMLNSAKVSALKGYNTSLTFVKAHPYSTTAGAVATVAALGYVAYQKGLFQNAESQNSVIVA